MPTARIPSAHLAHRKRISLRLRRSPVHHHLCHFIQLPSCRRASLFRPPTRPDSPVQPQTEQSSDVLQAIIISFPANLKSTPTSIDVSEPGLLWKVSRLYELIDSQAGYSASNSSVIFGNAYLNYERTLSGYGIISGDTVLLNPKRVCRKPVIYLYPPSSLPDVTVMLALTASWRFSAVYPLPQTTVPPGEPHTAQSLTWKITGEPNGTLIDKASRIGVSYLYWEAKEELSLLHSSMVIRPFFLFPQCGFRASDARCVPSYHSDSEHRDI